MSFDDLSRTRIYHRGSVRPSTGRTMHPVNHIVTHIHGVSTVGQYFYAKGILISRCLKSLVPPAGAIEQRTPDRFRRTGVQIINDGFNRLAQISIRIFLLQAVLCNKPFRDRFLDRCAVILIADAKIPGPGIKSTRLKTIIRQLYKRMMLTNGNGIRSGRHRAYLSARIVARKGQRCFKFGILWKVHGCLAIQRRTTFIDAETPFVALLQTLANAMGITDYKIRSINKDCIFILSRNFKSP